MQSQQESITPAQNFQKFNSEKPIIGLTGGIGSGKTTVSNWFAKQGIDVIDADVISHQITEKGSPTLLKLADALGNWIINEAGNMDRAAVREHVFGDTQALLTLEKITHPAIRNQIKQQLANANSPYVILSAPLLLESAEARLASLCDRVLVVDVSQETQLARASQRDTQNIEKIKSIMDNQLSRSARQAHADDIINNEGDIQDLYPQLTSLHHKYLALSKHG